MFKSNKAITLIAMVIAIVIILIVIGVSINLLTGNNGLIDKTKASMGKYQEATIKEQARTVLMELEQKKKFASRNSTMAEYIKEKTGGIRVDKGIIYEEDDEYFFVDNNNTVVALINKNGDLTVGDIIGDLHRNTVEYNANGGSGTLPESKEKTVGKTVNVSFEVSLTKEGYGFIGWSTNSNSTTAEYTAEGITSFTMPDENVTLYAIWDANKHNVIYNANGGNANSVPDTQIVSYSQTANIDFTVVPTRSNYRFVGWTDVENGTVEKYTSTGTTSFTMPNNNVTLYAVWKAEKRIKFDSNYTGNYTVASGTVAINNANGMYPTSYPSGNSNRYTVVNLTDNSINVGSKFEIIVNGFYNNDTASRIGYLTFYLLNSGTTVAYISLTDSWTATRVMNIGYSYLNNTLISYGGSNSAGYGYSFDGDLKITGDGSKVRAYLGNTLLNTINCSEGFSFDQIRISFGCYTTYPGIPMGVREIQIREL